MNQRGLHRGIPPSPPPPRPTFLHFSSVVSIGFLGDEERTIVEGSEIEICADLLNIDFQNYERFDDQFPVLTIDGTAQGINIMGKG